MNKHIGTHVDDFLKEESLVESSEAVALKRIIAYQIQEALKKKRMTKTSMAKQMHTSRAALDRLLDPENTSMTLNTLVKLARNLDQPLKYFLAV